MTDDFERAIAERQIVGNPYDAAESAGNRPRRPRKPVVEVLGLKLERDYQQDVTDYADAHGWQWFHPYYSQKSRPGWPDLVLWHPQAWRDFQGVETRRRVSDAGPGGHVAQFASGRRGCKGLVAAFTMGDCRKGVEPVKISIIPWGKAPHTIHEAQIRSYRHHPRQFGI